MAGRRNKQAIGIAAIVGASGLGALAYALMGSAGRPPPGPPQNDRVIDQALRAETIESAIAKLTTHYVFPDKAAAVAKQLRLQLQQGMYESVTSAQAFATALAEAVQRETQDKHIEVRYLEKPIPPESAAQEVSAQDNAAELIEQQRFNFGFAGVTRLRGNIGYIDLRAFQRPPHTAERIAASMTLLADTTALIIDLRHCYGGDPETVMQFASYLYDKPTHLNDIYWRDENRTEERWTQESVAGKKYGEARPLYLLTSGETFSGCEDFAYALKNNRRAIVVGETTGGGAHAGSPHRLSAHFMMFVPSGLPINPITHTDWEGVGVAPDIATSESKALDVAQVAVLKQIIAGETDTAWKQRLQRRVDELD